MASRTIAELRILPPLAIGRMGSSPQPMDNYTVKPNDGEGFRQLVPAPTLLVDEDGSISAQIRPEELRFKDDHKPPRIKPVAPFLELWVRFADEENLEPLTLEGLESAGLAAEDVLWSLDVGNRKMVRRTGDPNDGISGKVEPEMLVKHKKRRIWGVSENFKQDKDGKLMRIPMGHVQYIRPTEEFPEIRIRITPPEGLVYGAKADDIIPKERAVYDVKKGAWPEHSDRTPPQDPQLPLARQTTVPFEIYAIYPGGKNRGFFDDAWDGILAASVRVSEGETMQAKARVSVGPPDFAPDSFPVRTLQDEFDQLVHGPNVAPEEVDVDQTIDIVRRALETMQLMDVSFLNSDRYHSRFPNGALWLRVRDAHKGLLDGVQGLKADANTPARSAAISALNRMRGFLREYTEVWDGYRTSQKMPAMMRGSDYGNLALTRRQKATIEAAYQKYKDTGGEPTEPEIRRTSFALHILPCFRDEDINAMKNLGGKSIDLTSYDEVKAKSDLILKRLKGQGNLMPPVANDGPWPNEWIELFERWIQEKYPQ
ncbi:MAG: hypothetical protein O3A00_01845 [Planctomycetota bacterium]|nr:hypothetical protein [Planctomycetota bacterium]